MSTKWALLIGIDFYYSGDKRKVKFEHLKGCVNDVSRIEEYLRSTGVRNIHKLVASYNNNDDKPKEADPKCWPTYDNIISKINDICNQVNPGDVVWIHYSGHGILRQNLGGYNIDLGDTMNGTALALTDVQRGGAYLTGYQLGVWVRKLVEIKKTRVNVTLDSCYSGRGFRGDNDVALRTSRFNKADDSQLDSDNTADSEAIAEECVMGSNSQVDGNSGSNNRNATVKRSWLSSPEGCTVLTACQLDQEAGEYLFDGQRNGIMTHWLLSSINTCRLVDMRPPTYEYLAQQIKHRIKAEMSFRQPQTPVLHGDSFYEFFGNQKRVQQPACFVQVLDQPGTDKQIYGLDVGSAQGVSTSAEYLVYPELSSEMGFGTAPRVRIYEVSALRSKARIVGKTGTAEQMTIINGSRAVLDIWCLPLEQRVNFTASLSHGDVQLDSLFGGLQRRIQRIPHLSLSPDNIKRNDDGDVNYSIAFDRSTRELVIETGRSERMPRIPAISADDESATCKLSYLINHLARFHALRNLDYGKPLRAPEPNGYKFELLDENSGAIKFCDGAYETRNDQEVNIRFMNNSNDDTVHVAVFMFNATWGIERLYPEDGQPTAQVGHGEEQALTHGLEMCIPPVAWVGEQRDIKDLIRAYIYVGDHPPSWDELLLDEIPAKSSLIPTKLSVEPCLDEESADESILRNKKKKRKNQIARDATSREGRWSMVEFWVHTTEA